MKRSLQEIGLLHRLNSTWKAKAMGPGIYKRTISVRKKSDGRLTDAFLEFKTGLGSGHQTLLQLKDLLRRSGQIWCSLMLRWLV